jgi:hypothetical protein
MQDFSQRLMRHVFLPLDDTALRISQLMASLPASWSVAGPDAERTDFALTKQRQTQLARESGFRVPSF